MHPKKIQNLISLSANERYEYFIREVVQRMEVWVLSTSEGYVIFKDRDNDEIFPVWPSKELADRCSFQEFREMGAAPKNIAFKSFLDSCIPDMINDKVVFGVFYDDKRSGIVVDGDKLFDDLNSEYREIWGE